MLKAPSAYASSTIAASLVAVSRAWCSSSAVSPMLSRPGPIRITSASAVIVASSSLSDRAMTLASGTAMLSAAAVDDSTASCSRPAPARSAPTPASSTAPGV